MKYVLILNACSSTYQHHAETINSYINRDFSGENIGQTILIYDDETRKDQFIHQVPTKELVLLKVAQYQAEIILNALTDYFKQSKSDLIIFSPGFAGLELSTRLAVRLKGTSLANVEQIEVSKNGLVFKKNVYSNHLRGVFELSRKPFCISLKNDTVDPLAVPACEHNILSEIDVSHESADFVYSSSYFQDKKSDQLENSAIVIVAGQGVGSNHAIESLQDSAKQLGAELGISRPVAMNAWGPMHRMIGVSGLIIKPELCIVVAASGAAAFMVGIEKSRLIIAINRDMHAPIVKQSDVTVIDDYQEVLDGLLRLIQNMNNNN